MPSRNHQNWLRAYAEFTRYSESPDLFHFWTGVSVIAGALRRQVWIDERYFQWTPNFYIIIVGPAGVAAKSTCVRIGMKLLNEVDGVKFGPQSMTWQALTESLANARCEVPYGDPPEYYLPMSCLTCPVSELGTFLKPDDPALIDTLVSLWDGQLETWTHETKTMGSTEIVNPWINVIGCTTPSWLRANFPETMIGGGLTSRVVFVYGDKKRHFVPYPSQLIPEDHFAKESASLIEDLQRIGTMRGEYELTREAQAWGSEWYKDLWQNRPVHLAGDRFQGYVARKQTHLHKVAMVLAAAQRDELVIEEGDLSAANDLVTALEHDMQIVFKSIGYVPSAANAQAVLDIIHAFSTITRRELWRRCWGEMDPKGFTEAVSSLLEAGYITAAGDNGPNRIFMYARREETEVSEEQAPPSSRGKGG